jgi:hypothetical protein
MTVTMHRILMIVTMHGILMIVAMHIMDENSCSSWNILSFSSIIGLQ